VRNILVVHYTPAPWPRASTRDHLYAFRRYSGCRCFYLNLALRMVPWYIARISFDLIVFTTYFLGARWTREDARRAVTRARRLRSLGGVKIALPQDEFVNTTWLCGFINEFGVDYVFSVAPESEWPVLYPTVDVRRVGFVRVLTGYLDEATLRRIAVLARAVPERPIAIGYRTAVLPWWGRFGWIRKRLAEVFTERARSRGWRTDISTQAGAFFNGDDWFRFLLRCRYTLGVEGGASLLDPVGTIQEQCLRYLVDHPGATFEELEAACFPRRDGSLRLRTLSPRHLEACATRTCQILVEGEYSGVLVPGRHYIELKEDFRNLDEVLSMMQHDHLREEITECAYREIVESGRFTYRRFVEFVLERALGPAPARPRSAAAALAAQAAGWWNGIAEGVSLLPVIVLIWLKRLLPAPVKRTLRRVAKRRPTGPFAATGTP